MDIKVSEFKQRMISGENLFLLDVREENEYDQFNFNGFLISLGDLPDRIQEIEHWKNEEVIVHCHSGRRSEEAKHILERNGFLNVRNLIGGILAYNEI